MSLNPHHKQQTVKALNWLDKQEGDWSYHIKDTNLAIKMYLKSQNQVNTKKEDFSKEIKKFLKAGTSNKLESSLPLKKPIWRDHKIKQNTVSSSCSKEEKIIQNTSSIQEEWGAFLKKEVVKPDQKKISTKLVSSSPPAKQTAEDKKSLDFLDGKSLETLEKTKNQLNLQSKEEVLRLLIQLGRKSLDKLIPDTI